MDIFSMVVWGVLALIIIAIVVSIYTTLELKGYFNNLVKDNAEQTKLISDIKYFSFVALQFQITFWISLILAFLGVVFLFYEMYLQGTGHSNVGTEKLIIFGILEIVALLFLILSNSANKTMAGICERFRTDITRREVMKCVDAMSDKKLQEAAKLHLSLHYAGVPSATSIAAKLIDNLQGNDDKPPEEKGEKGEKGGKGEKAIGSQTTK